MEQLVPVNSGPGPVYRKVDSAQFKAADRRNNVQIVTVEVPVRVPGDSKAEEAREPGKLFDRVASSALVQNYGNFKRSSEPERVMYYKDGGWIEFCSEVVERAKAAFSERNPMPEIDVDGNRYVFDFYRMLQIDVVNCAQRSIAWVDVSKRCYFPKFFVDDCVDTCSDVPKVEIEIKVENNLVRAKRKRNEKLDFEDDAVDTADSSFVCESKNAKIRRLGELDGSKWPKARLIKEEEATFSAVGGLFLSGMKSFGFGVEITSIYQFNRAGIMEKARSEVFQKQLELTRAARGKENMVYAWHGTSKEGVESILARGFALPSKIISSNARGNGIHLFPTRLPNLSHLLSETDDNGERHVVLCRVILGNTEKVEARSNQSHPSSVEFDTGVDDTNNPKCYVVWSTIMNTHILPEYVISYKCSNPPQGSNQATQMNRTTQSNPVAVKLFTELRTKLPSPKIEALKSLVVSYKVGNMARDAFIRGLRSVAGDVMLRSIMREIQSAAK